MTIDDYISPPASELNLVEMFTALTGLDQAELHAKLEAISYPDFLESTYWKCVAFVVKRRDGNHQKVGTMRKFTDQEQKIVKILEVRQRVCGGGETGLLQGAVSLVAQMLDSEEGIEVVRELVEDENNDLIL